MEFQRTYDDCDIIVEFHDDILDAVTIVRGDDTLVHRYYDDQVLECLFNGHSVDINNNVFVGNVGKTEYHKGLVSVTDKGSVHVGDIQVEAGNPLYNRVVVYYKGKYMMQMNSFIDNSDKLDNPTHLQLFRVSKSNTSIDVKARFKDSESMLFLLGLAKDEALPYNQIVNLPGIGIQEFVMAMSDLYRSSVHLTYMEKLFGNNTKDMLFEVNEEINGCVRYTDITAALNNCYMKMRSDGSDYTCSICDSNDELHDFNLSSDMAQLYHHEVMIRLPKLYLA